MQLVLITFEFDVQNTKSVGFNNFMMDAFALFLYSQKTTGRRNLFFANSRVNNKSHFTTLQMFEHSCTKENCGNSYSLF